MHVLLVEDDPRVAGSVKKGLEEARYQAVVAASAAEARRQIDRGPPDIVILDLGLPDEDGLAVLIAARKRFPRLPVLILTARDRVEDKVQGLEHGADDYLVKPFAFSELLARIRALLRRAQGGEPRQWRVMDLEIDLVERTVSRGGKNIELSLREFDLLAYLARHTGQTVSREMLTRDVWKIQSRATPMDNLIDVYISHLRGKIDNDFGAKLLHTVRGVGFVLGPAA